MKEGEEVLHHYYFKIYKNAFLNRKAFLLPLFEDYFLYLRYSIVIYFIMGTVKEYSNGEVTIVWEPELCVHSGICTKGLSAVFKPNVKPWINANGATSDEIVNQVKQCPSGALSFYFNKKNKEDE